MNVFRSLRVFNYRLWAAGALVSNIGTWVQRTAQDWLVLTELTQHNASAVGIVMALQFGPQLLLLPWTGLAADHFDQRKLLLFTQATMGALALALGILTIAGAAQLWHVYLFAFLFGCASAFDAPVRQIFVAELVPDADLPNAVALNSTSFNAARMIGPAAAGFVIASVGTGWAFVLNGLSFVAVLGSLMKLRTADMRTVERSGRGRGSLIEGFRYIGQHAELRVMMVMLFLIGTFGLNFQLFIATMAVRVFQTDAGGFGLLSSMMAVGTVLGTLLAASRDRPRFTDLVAAALVFGVGTAIAALVPGYREFGASLVLVGVAAMIFTTGTNSLTQLSTEPSMRGRVMAIRLAIILGCTPIGAPLMGWIADQFGPRWALAVGALSAFAAAAVAIRYLRTRPKAAR